MIDELKKPRAARHSSSVRINNSTWQNLYLKREEVENAFFHDPIIALAGKYGVAVPYNEVALELVTRSCREKTGPGQLRAAEIVDLARSRGATN